MRRFAQFLLIGCFLAIPGIAQRGGGGFQVVAAVDFTAVAVVSRWMAVVSMAEWVASTVKALSAQDFEEVVSEDSAAASFQGTALALGLAFPATGLITAPDGVILTTVIPTILTRLIHTPCLFLSILRLRVCVQRTRSDLLPASKWKTALSDQIDIPEPRLGVSGLLVYGGYP